MTKPIFEGDSSEVKIPTLQDINPIHVEVVDDSSYANQQNTLEKINQQDQQARARAQKLLKQYAEGFTPNLIQQKGLLPYDGILASKAILQLLSLSLAEDEQCPKGAGNRSPFSRATAYNTARSCGKRLHFVGGSPLMQRVLKEWIPAFDQPDLSQTWSGIGDWSGSRRLENK